MQKKCRADWKRYRDSSVTYLKQHISDEDTVSLLWELPTKKMKLSGHVRTQIQKKATMVMVFLKYTQNRDDDQYHFKLGGKHALDIAADVGDLLGSKKTAVYNA